MSHLEKFTKVYADNIWGGSGGGSLPDFTKTYRQFLEDWMFSHSIESVVDFGCGDWMFSYLIDWSNVSYLGVDCVKSVIEENLRKHSRWGIAFMHCPSTEEFFDEIPGADLLIVKDVFQHWSNADVVSFLTQATKRYQYILITNGSNQTEDWEESPDPVMTAARHLAARFEPLKGFGARKVLDYADNPNDPKEISQITRD